MRLMNSSNTLTLILGEKVVLKLCPRFVVDDFSILKQALVGGLGIGVLSDYMCKGEVQSGRLIRVLPE